MSDEIDQTERNRRAVREAFEQFVAGDAAPFFAMVADDVRWTVIGSTPISGTYESKRDFIKGASGKLFSGLKGPLTGSIRNVFADGDHVIVQWQAQAEMASGGTYDQTYCWVLRLDDSMIVESDAYLDTEMVRAVLT
jgi:ketosteroid isomerase-like protein